MFRFFFLGFRLLTVSGLGFSVFRVSGLGHFRA